MMMMMMPLFPMQMSKIKQNRNLLKRFVGFEFIVHQQFERSRKTENCSSKQQPVWTVIKRLVGCFTWVKYYPGMSLLGFCCHMSLFFFSALQHQADQHVFNQWSCPRLNGFGFSLHQKNYHRSQLPETKVTETASKCQKLWGEFLDISIPGGVKEDALKTQPYLKW